MAIADQPRVLGLALAESWRRVRRRVSGGVGFGFSSQTPERLLIAPPDLHTADPTVATEIYAGIFRFGSCSVETGGENPFTMQSPDPRWSRELHGFGWLRHFGAARDTLATSNAQALVRDWIRHHPRPNDGIAWEPVVAAERLRSWLCHSVFIIENAELGFYRAFLKSLGIHMRHVRRSIPNCDDGMPKLLSSIALSYGAVCMAAGPQAAVAAARSLDAELAKQILPDGGHASRNPAVLPELLAQLLPLRQSHAKLGQAPSQELVSAIDRIMSAIRFYRMGDGSLTRVNGCSVTARDLVATVMRYDDAGSGIPAEAPFSGFQRMQSGETVILLDHGKPPPGPLSVNAHAGCLAFEMSSGAFPFIVNCGAPTNARGDLRKAARSTAAHSTAIVNETSSCKFSGDGVLSRVLDNRIIAGPRNITCNRHDTHDSQSVSVSHDGYLRDFGLVHERSLILSGNGTVLDGLDTFLAPGSKPLKEGISANIVIRFHLHPSVSAGRSRDGKSILLSVGDGSRWVFAAPLVQPRVEESIYLAASAGARRTKQIVLEFDLLQMREVSWRLERHLA
ncbi:MAG: heparinase II/III family protein [Nitratireductor sp.]|nr:heparinase II/III family protein [Nitratireductor sp.]MCB1455517.1 heparinase II/III family protein [Nitratireductor sp.]MCB1457669.1 heparinase II/III family protein [Nitratireductor sp.]